MRFVDANIFLRALAEPQNEADRLKAQSCAALFQRLSTGEELGRTIEAIITEVAYVLRSRAHYHLAPAEIAARLRPILALRGLRLTNKQTYLRALDLWEAHPALDFEDVLSIAHMERLGLKEILSYDTDFDNVPGVDRIEPK